MDCSMPGSSALHHLPEFVQIHVRWVSDAIQPSHSLLHPSPPALNLPQHQGLFQWLSSSYPVAKVLELQLQHQSCQWMFRVDFFQDWLVWSPCCPRGSQESSPAPQEVYLRSQIPGLLHRMATAEVWVPVVLLELSVFLDAELSFTLICGWILTHPSLVPLFNSLGEFHFGLVEWQKWFI